MIDRDYVEEVNANGFSIKYRITDVLFSGRSEFQKVEIVQTQSHGRMLLNDGLVMVSERDEYVYHEMIAHVPLFLHPNPRNVLIIGGGDGGTAREVLRHKSVQKVDMVEIDGMVVDACRKYLRQTADGMDENSRLRLFIQDGVKFVAESSDTYDVIVIDSTDPIGPATPLFGSDFYRNVSRRLNRDGVVVAQGESPFYNSDTQRAMAEIYKGIFPVNAFYNFTNLTYPGGLWSFGFASNGLKPVLDFHDAKVEQSGMKFKYYNAQIHRAAFSLPEFQKANLGSISPL